MVKTILPPKKFNGRTYYPMSVTHTKKEALDFVTFGKRVNEYYLRIVSWPKNVSIEEYWESHPGTWNEPQWVVYASKKR